ncbi:hypothetical protein, partial [Streptomyces sp. NPDC089795]|uniref:hypothetical protein n=1 Tax=Streptomyces sp. NPDC089795 TaxID=3155297 RepID=UPI003438EEA3
MEQLSSPRLAADPKVALGPEILANAQLLRRSLQKGEGGVEGWLVLGWVYFHRIRAQEPGTSQNDWIAAVEAFTPCFIADVEPLPEVLLPVIVDSVVISATSILERVDRSEVRAVVRLWHRIVAATALDDPMRARRLSHLSIALQRQFDMLGDPGDQDAAVAFAEEAVKITPADHSPPAEVLFNAGSFAWSRFGVTQEPADLDKALDYMQRAVAAGLPDSPLQGEALITLAVALQERFQRRTDPSALDEAIAVFRRAVVGGGGGGGQPSPPPARGRPGAGAPHRDASAARRRRRE